MDLTINQVVEQLREIATNHKQINTFGFGQLPELGKSEPVVYPVMWVQQMPSRVDGNDLRLKYQFLFADLVHKDISNETDVSSDQMQTALDVVAQLQHPDYDWTFEASSSLEPVYGKLDDEVTGWIMELDIIIANPYNRCAIPFDPSPTPEEEIGFVTIYASDGITIVDRVSNNGYYVLVGGGGSATVENSDGSYADTVNAGDTLVLPDENFDVYVNSILNTSFVYVPLSGDSINITA